MTLNPFDNLVNYWKNKDVKKSDIEKTIRRIQDKLNETEPGTCEFEKLSMDLEQGLKNKKLYKEAKGFGVKPDTVLVMAVALAIGGFGLALSVDNPMALKMSSYALKMPGFKI